MKEHQMDDQPYTPEGIASGQAPDGTSYLYALEDGHIYAAPILEGGGIGDWTMVHQPRGPENVTLNVTFDGAPPAEEALDISHKEGKEAGG